jgi:hypothetical protein
MSHVRRVLLPGTARIRVDGAEQMLTAVDVQWPPVAVHHHYRQTVSNSQSNEMKLG